MYLRLSPRTSIALQVQNRGKKNTPFISKNIIVRVEEEKYEKREKGQEKTEKAREIERCTY